MNDNGAGLILGFVVFAAVLGGGAMACAAWIVHMGTPPTGIGEAIVGIVLHGKGPTEAWGISGSDSIYWVVVAGLLVGAVMFVSVLIRLVVRKRWGTKRRQRLGSDTETRLATAKDLETLWIGWKPGGRFLLGRTHGRFGTNIGSKLLGSEWRADPNARRLSRSARRRRSDRSFGEPAQSRCRSRPRERRREPWRDPARDSLLETSPSCPERRRRPRPYRSRA